MITRLPIKLYYDSYEEGAKVWKVTSPPIVTYDVFKINELRNFKTGANISTSDESPFIMAGIYIFVKMATPGDKPELWFFDPTKSPLLAQSVSNDDQSQSGYVGSEIIKYISANYSNLKNDVELVQGIPTFIKP